MATSLLDVEPVTLSTLNFVIKHVQESTSRTSCLLDIIDLTFVYGSNKSYEKFVREFSNITIPEYKLLKEGDLYYLAKNYESVVDRREETSFVTSLNTEKSPESESVIQNDTFHVNDFNINLCSTDAKTEGTSVVNEFMSQSDLSSINGSIVGTDGGIIIYT